MDKFVIDPEGYAEFSFRVYSPADKNFVETEPFLVDAGEACFALDAARDECGTDHAAFVAKLREFIHACGGPQASQVSVGQCLAFARRVDEVAEAMAKKKAPGSPPPSGGPPPSESTSSPPSTGSTLPPGRRGSANSPGMTSPPSSPTAA